MSQQLFIQEHAGAFALVVGAIGANLALEWFVTARERMAGGGLRGWGIATLGRSFRRDVTIQADHRVVIDGPYRLLRHPAYAGNLLAALGFGLALTNWVGLVVAVGVPLLGHLPRIRVEKRATAGALGQEWAGCAAGTARIVPGVW
ncbi:MAG TPA: isoprenylcysteine carboxylmethyltransferase family protein [Gaiellales bacterium]|nr:isoprenylcysteine carboxylmethyltransferase family protein [Gaiellales bacterium]